MYNSDKNILLLIKLLLFKGEVPSEKNFASKINMLSQTISKIRKGKAHFTPEHIEQICLVFNVNANWIFGIQENVFNDENSIKNSDLKALLGLAA